MMNVLEGRMKWFKDLTQDLEVSLPRSMFRRFVGLRLLPRLFGVVPAEGWKSRKRDSGNVMNYSALTKASRVLSLFHMVAHNKLFK